MLVHDLLAEQALEDVFQGDEAVEAAVLVSQRDEVHAVLEEHVEQLVGGELLRDELDRVGEVAQGQRRLRLEQQTVVDLAAVDLADDRVEVAGLGDRDAAVDPLRGLGDELAQRRVGRIAVHDRAGRAQIACGDAVEHQRVAHPLRLLAPHLAALGREHGRGHDVVFARAVGTALTGDGVHRALGDPHDRPDAPDHELDRARDHQAELVRVLDAEALRHDLREGQDQHGEDRREDPDGRTAEEVADHRAAPGGADGVRDRVDRQDRRDGLLDVTLELGQQLPGLAALPAQHVDPRGRNGVEHGLEERAEEGGQQREAGDDEDRCHGRAVGRHRVAARWARVATGVGQPGRNRSPTPDVPVDLASPPARPRRSSICPRAAPHDPWRSA